MYLLFRDWILCLILAVGCVFLPVILSLTEKLMLKPKGNSASKV
jgi:hypothetical protein